MRAARIPAILAVAAVLTRPAGAQQTAELHTVPVRAPQSEAPIDSGVSTRLAVQDAGATVRVLTRRDFDTMPGRTVADVLRSLPEIQVTRLGLEGTLGTLSLRGAGP